MTPLFSDTFGKMARTSPFHKSEEIRLDNFSNLLSWLGSVHFDQTEIGSSLQISRIVDFRVWASSRIRNRNFIPFRGFLFQSQHSFQDVWMNPSVINLDLFWAQVISLYKVGGSD